MIVGARNDPEWGVVLLVGFGGVASEAMRDIRLLAPELTGGCDRQGSVPVYAAHRCSADFAERRRWTRWHSRRSWRRLGQFMLRCPWVQEVDINPVVVYPEGAVALDALILGGRSHA